MLNVTFIGHLGAAAEKISANGSQFIKFRAAHTRKWKSADGQQHEDTIWVDCIINDANSNLFPYLTAGTLVYVSGPISLRVYSSKADRCMKAGLTINCKVCELVGARADIVPSVLYSDTGERVSVTKHYYQQAVHGGELKNIRGDVFLADANGFVTPAPSDYVSKSDSVDYASDNAPAF